MQQAIINETGFLLAGDGCDTVGRIMIRLVVKQVAEKAGITNARVLAQKADPP